MFFPFIIYSLLLIGYPPVYTMDLNIPCLLISNFPAEFQNVFTIAICILTETILLSVYLTWAFYFVFIAISFILTFIQWTQLQAKKLENG